MFKVKLDYGKHVLPSTSELERLIQFMSGSNVLCITGAGISTESGIPDYRSPNGSYSRGHKPMIHNDFVSSEANRQRYWARSVIGFKHFSKAKTNAGHHALTTLHDIGNVSSIITQNVDRLHHQAGFPKSSILELHGNNEEVICLGCQAIFPRKEYQHDIATQNQTWIDESLHFNEKTGEVRADGDAEVMYKDLHKFHVPNCPICNGIIKPHVVFFGGSVPNAVKEKSFEMVKKADKLLLVGTSASTWSCFRLCKEAAESGKEIGVLNVGETRADSIAALKIERKIGPTLSKLADSLAL